MIGKLALFFVAATKNRTIRNVDSSSNINLGIPHISASDKDIKFVRRGKRQAFAGVNVDSSEHGYKLSKFYVER